jgi:hypothetical protein
MQTSLPVMLVTLLVTTACQKEAIPVAPAVASASPLSKAFFASMPHSANIKNVSSVDLARLATSTEAVKFTISLRTEQGIPLKNGDAVQPNTVYQIAIHGQSAAQFVLKMAESFEVIQSPPATATENATYLIKTKAEVLPQLYLSVVPLRTDNGVLTKNTPANFLLPNLAN